WRARAGIAATRRTDVARAVPRLGGVDERAEGAHGNLAPGARPGQRLDGVAPQVQVGCGAQLEGPGPGPPGGPGPGVRVLQGRQGADPGVQVVAVGEDPGLAQGL